MTTTLRRYALIEFGSEAIHTVHLCSKSNSKQEKPSRVESICITICMYCRINVKPPVLTAHLFRFSPGDSCLVLLYPALVLQAEEGVVKVEEEEEGVGGQGEVA